MPAEIRQEIRGEYHELGTAVCVDGKGWSLQTEKGAWARVSSKTALGIQLYVAEMVISTTVSTENCSGFFQDKRAVERLDVEKVYHPFIAGPYNKLVSELMQETGTRINIPPPSVNKTEIVFTGEKEQLAQAVARVKKIYEEKVWMVPRASHLPPTCSQPLFPFLFYFCASLSCILLMSALAQQLLQYMDLGLTISLLSRVGLGVILPGR